MFRYYVLFALFVFGTALKPFLGDDNRNFLLIGFMMLSPALALARRIPSNHLILYCFMVSITLLPSMMNPEKLRWSTIFYSLLFSISFLAYENVLRRSRIHIDDFTGAVRLLLLAYFALLVVQQICVLTGLPIINASNYTETSPWKLNSLSAEASHTARIINVLMLAYISLQEISAKEKYSLKRQFRRDLYIWLGYIWSTLTMLSATAVLLFPIILFKVSNRKNIGYAMSIIGLGTLCIIGLDMFSLTPSRFEEFTRISSILEAAGSFDYNLLLAADHSGSMRIAPLFVLADMIELLSWQGMFGHGIDTVSTFMSDYIYGVEKGYSGGGMLQVWYEYGFVTFFLFVIFSMRVASALRSVSNFIMWLLIVFVAGPNNQIVWLYLIAFASLKYFRDITSWCAPNGLPQMRGWSKGTAPRRTSLSFSAPRRYVAPLEAGSTQRGVD